MGKGIGESFRKSLFRALVYDLRNLHLLLYFSFWPHLRFRLLNFLLGFVVTLLLALYFFLFFFSPRRFFFFEWFFDTRIIIDQKIVIFFTPSFKINIVSFENFIVQVVDILDKEILNNLIVSFLLKSQTDSSLIPEVLAFVVDVQLFKLLFECCLQDLQMLFRSVPEMNFTDLQLKMGWFGVAAFMERVSYLVWALSSPVDSFKQFYSFYLSSSSHVVALIAIENLKLIDFVVGAFELNLFAKEIDLGGVSLLNNDLDDVFAFEEMVFEYGDELNNDLNKCWCTSCLLMRSTLGYIFSMRCFMNNLKLSISFRYRKTPWTAPWLSSIPMQMVPPCEFRKETMVFSMVHLALSSLRGSWKFLYSVVRFQRISFSLSRKEVWQPMHSIFYIQEISNSLYSIKIIQIFDYLSIQRQPQNIPFQLTQSPNIPKQTFTQLHQQQLYFKQRHNTIFKSKCQDFAMLRQIIKKHCFRSNTKINGGLFARLY